MAITNINGVPWTNVVNVGGIAKASITNIGGATPSAPGPTCTSTYLGYADARRFGPQDACTAPFNPYDVDFYNGMIYYSGGCNNPSLVAVVGYYSDGGAIWYFDGSWMTVIEPCGRGR